VCRSFKDAGYVPEEWVDVLRSMQPAELREYIKHVNRTYTPDGLPIQEKPSPHRDGEVPSSSADDDGDGHGASIGGAASVASFWAAVATEIYLCNVCSGQEILRCNGRG
jgi:hypothetical protein